jgi:hypothetical protein
VVTTELLDAPRVVTEELDSWVAEEVSTVVLDAGAPKDEEPADEELSVVGETGLELLHPRRMIAIAMVIASEIFFMSLFLLYIFV